MFAECVSQLEGERSIGKRLCIHPKQRQYPQQVTLCPKPRNLPLAHRRDHRGVAERLAGMDVAQVDFDGRDADGRDGVAQRVGVVGERAGVDHDAVGPPAGVVDRVHQRALVVGLQDTQRCSALRRDVFQPRVDLRQRDRAIHARFTRAEEVEIGAVEDEDAFHSGLLRQTAVQLLFSPKRVLLWLK